MFYRVFPAGQERPAHPRGALIKWEAFSLLIKKATEMRLTKTFFCQSVSAALFWFYYFFLCLLHKLFRYSRNIYEKNIEYPAVL